MRVICTTHVHRPGGSDTDDCCHDDERIDGVFPREPLRRDATARDGVFRDYGVVFLSDCTGTYAYPDLGYGTLPAEGLDSN